MLDIGLKFYVVPTVPNIRYWSGFMLYLPGMKLDTCLKFYAVPAWPNVRYWSEVLCCTYLA